MRAYLLILTAIITLLPFHSAWAKTYILDPAQTNITFKVKNLFFNVKGSLDLLAGHCNIDLEENKLINTQIIIDASSINTGDPERDKSLRSKDFFYVDKYPKLSFRSTSVQGVDFSNYAQNVLSGILTIKGISQPVKLKISQIKTENQSESISGTAHTRINRLNYNIGTDVSDYLLGETVKIKVEFTAKAVKQYYQERKPSNE